MMKKIFVGGLGEPPEPPFSHFQRCQEFQGPPQTPEKYFFHHFQYFIDLFVLSAFQHAFTVYFTLTLSWYMMFLVKLGFLAAFLGIFIRRKSDVYKTPKEYQIHMCFCDIQLLRTINVKSCPSNQPYYYYYYYYYY